ncbi:MAG: GatB/YqeY domain-containing protein [Pseudomonadota bacterium]
MELRERLNTSLKAAMRDKDQKRVGTLRLVNAALKDRDIALRAEGKSVGDAEAMAILAKMVKQRQESARAYEEAGRLELAEQEQTEIRIVEEFLPKRLSDAEVEAAISAAIDETGAGSVRDMGRVMGVLKGRHPGQIDFGTVGPMVKARLA